VLVRERLRPARFPRRQPLPFFDAQSSDTAIRRECLNALASRARAVLPNGQRKSWAAGQISSASDIRWGEVGAEYSLEIRLGRRAGVRLAIWRNARSGKRWEKVAHQIKRLRLGCRPVISTADIPRGPRYRQANMREQKRAAATPAKGTSPSFQFEPCGSRLPRPPNPERNPFEVALTQRHLSVMGTRARRAGTIVCLALAPHG